MYLVAACNAHMIWWHLATFCSFFPEGPAIEELAFIQAYKDSYNILVIDCYTGEIVYRQDCGTEGYPVGEYGVMRETGL